MLAKSLNLSWVFEKGMKMEKQQVSVFNVSNINGNLNIACNGSFVDSLASIMVQLDERSPKVLKDFTKNLENHVTGKIVSEENEDQICFVAEIADSFVIACSNSFAKVFHDYLDDLLPHDGTLKAVHAFAVQVKRQINYRDYQVA